uniref:Small kinetochore-associated protein isoform X2 n=1 Tax=Castor canadensis TaxID=51338 RepID=A0A8B7W9U3_CASCN|nr:small kinetochore-associated protein isoform X2 [Castor canadensis]
MAAPKAAARRTVCRTTGPPTDDKPHSLPPSYRKFSFESEAADPDDASAVAAKPLLNQSDQDCGPEQRTSGVQPCRLVTMTSVVKTVYSVQPPSAPADPQTRATFKSQLPVKSKEVDVSRHLHSGSSENDITKATKPRRENGQMKVAETAIKRNIRKGYNPVSKQKSEEELKDKNQILEAVNKQLHQKLTETQLLLETLQDELKLFNETAKKQMEELQALKVKLKMKEEERLRFLEQQALCNGQVNDFTLALEEMEQLLEM